jgi:DNA primase
VEGYFDVMSMHQEGFQEAVAVMGTSFGQEHARLLSAYVQEVVLLFDGDQAGRRAIRQTAPYLLKEGLKVKVLLLPEGEDPDTYVKKFASGLRKSIESAEEIFESLLKENSKQALEDYLYFCAFVKDKVRQMELLSVLSKKTNLPMAVLRGEDRRASLPSEEIRKLKGGTKAQLPRKGIPLWAIHGAW